jgi:isopentenyldiphosphate isomerase
MDEYIDILDEDGKKTGKRELKDIAHEKELFHESVHCIIYNERGEILLQLRAKNKKTNPGKWDVSAAGHISSGEKPIVSILREIKEELGIKAKKENLEFYQKQKHVIPTGNNNLEKEFIYVYFFNYNGDINNFTIQVDELEEIKFVKIKELEKDIKINPDKYVPHEDYWIEIIDLLKNKALI